MTGYILTIVATGFVSLSDCQDATHVDVAGEHVTYECRGSGPAPETAPLPVPKGDG